MCFMHDQSDDGPSSWPFIISSYILICGPIMCFMSDQSNDGPISCNVKFCKGPYDNRLGGREGRGCKLDF